MKKRYSKVIKEFTWQHIYTKEICVIKSHSQYISGLKAIDILKKLGEDNEIKLINVKIK